MIYLKNSGIEIYNDNASHKTLYFLAAEYVRPPVPKDCCVVMVYPYDWSEMMTPWANAGRGMENTGGGGDFAAAFETVLRLPVESGFADGVRWRGIAGYSLGGLEALYMAARMKDFDYAGSVSGSLWYAGAAAYFEANPLDERVKKAYLSLGAKEDQTKDAERRLVRRHTDALAERMGRSVKLRYEINDGGHFTDIARRIGKCIAYFAEEESPDR